MPRGLISPHRNGRRQPYRVRVRFPDNSVRVLSTRQYELGAAREAARRMQREAARGEDVNARKPARLDELCRRYLDSRAVAGGRQGHGCAPATIDCYREKCQALELHLGAARDANRLRLQDLEAFIATRRAYGVSDQTIGKELRVLRAVLARGKREGLVRLDVDAVWPEFRTRYQPRKRHLTLDEFTRLREKLPDDRRATVEFIVYTGARAAEWPRVEARHVRLSEGVLTIPGTKTEKSARKLPLATHPALRELLARRLQARSGGLLFRGWTAMRRDLRKACERAKIAPVSPNDLRRTFGSWLRQAGVSPDRIAVLMGTSTRMVELVYGRLRVEDLAGDLGRAFAASKVQSIGPQPEAA